MRVYLESLLLLLLLRLCALLSRAWSFGVEFFGGLIIVLAREGEEWAEKPLDFGSWL